MLATCKVYPLSFRLTKALLLLEPPNYSHHDLRWTGAICLRCSDSCCQLFIGSIQGGTSLIPNMARGVVRNNVSICFLARLKVSMHQCWTSGGRFLPDVTVIWRDASPSTHDFWHLMSNGFSCEHHQIIIVLHWWVLACWRGSSWTCKTWYPEALNGGGVLKLHLSNPKNYTQMYRIM